MSGPDERTSSPRQLFHDLSNALNAISMQAELARVQIERRKMEDADAALQSILEGCRRAASVNQALRETLTGKKSGD